MLNPMISAVLALVGALLYGAADFFGGVAAKRLRSIVVTAVAGLSGLIALAIALPLVGGVWTLADMAWGALAGLFGLIAVALLYACLAVGPMSILSPLTAVISAIAPMLWGLLIDGETLSPVAYAGLGVALVAVVLVGFIPGEKVVRPSARGLLMAVGAGAAIGGFLIVLDQTATDSGLVPLVMSRATTVVVTSAIVAGLAMVAVRRGLAAASVLTPAGTSVGATPSGHADLEHASTGATAVPQPAPPVARAWWLAIVCGVVDAAANVLLLVALRGGELSIVSALTALYPAGTILLAAIVLRERVAGIQWLGLALALVAGGMLALG
jgi:drug/metabolite transporter (DMT)-like permease